ncbi:MAG: IS66 family insertion sequence element accessory protein TnpB [Gammaproteobacteria bacterium]|jgi:hypothetical protein|nr:IS66 family insertion sequence element accessory protein TnpB [Gammaproteobacteria bacterium]
MTRTELARIWLAHVEEQQCSGMSQRAYCAAHDLSLRGFVYWRRKQRNTATLPATPHLVPVRLLEEPAPVGVSGSGVRLHSGRVMIDLAVQFDAATLQRVLGVLESRC